MLAASLPANQRLAEFPITEGTSLLVAVAKLVCGARVVCAAAVWSALRTCTANAAGQVSFAKRHIRG